MEEEQNETIDSLNDENDGTTAIAEEVSDADTISEEDDASVLVEKNKRLFMRAKKAEADLKALKQKPVLVEKKPSISIDEETILRKIDERLEQRDVDSLSLSDELKKEIKSYAKLNGVSVKEASNSSYIQFRQKEESEKARIDDASINSTHKTMANRNLDEVNPDKDFDMSTKDGREAYHKWHEEWKKTH